MTNKKDGTGKRKSQDPASTSKSSKRNNGSAGGSGDDSPVHITERITPEKSPNDPNSYRVIRLSNGLTAALISRKNPSTGEAHHIKTNKAQLMCPPIPSIELNKEKLLLSFGPVERIQPSYHRESPCLTEIMKDPFCCDVNTGPRQSVSTSTSVALVVNVGGLEDPLKCQGLAHFTEHMVHHGSEKFPQEEAIDLLIGNFGDNNASTRDHSTSYSNEVPDDFLEKNLELFSEMLSHPLFSVDCLSREVNAVDDEFYLRLPHIYQHILLPHLAIRNKDHPLKRFLCGNLSTLTDCRNQNGQRVQGVMKENHKEKYVATAMTLAINSTKSLEELEEITLTHFSKLPRGTHEVLYKLGEEAPSDPLILQNTNIENRHVYVQGGSSSAELNLVWMLPSSVWTNNSNEKVVDMIWALFSDTSENSLKAYLLREGLVWGMASGFHNTQYASEFVIMMNLTEAGQGNVDGILDATFNFINALKKISKQDMERFFQESKIANLRSFHYGSQDCSSDFTEDCAMRLQYSGTLSKVINAESWKDAVFNHKSIVSALNLLESSRMVKIEILPKQRSLAEIQKRENCKVPIQTIPYVKVPYIVVTKKRCPKQTRSQCEFRLPQANIFLKDEYAKNCGNDGAGDSGDWFLLCPENNGNIGQQRLKWKSGTDSNSDNFIPKIFGAHLGHEAVGYDKYLATVVLHFISPLSVGGTSHVRALACLWAKIINNKMQQHLMELFMGGYLYSVAPGMVVYVQGYPKYMVRVVETILTHIFDTGITEAELTLAKEYCRVTLEEHMSHFEFVAGTLIQSVFSPVPSIDLLGEFEDITINDLCNSIVGFKRSTFCYVQLVGNISVKSFEDIARSLEKRDFGLCLANVSMSLFSLNYALTHPAILVPGETCVRVKILASSSFTTSVRNLYVVGLYVPESKEAACFDIAMRFIYRKSFYQLRTTEQLGYVVFAKKEVIHRMRIPIMAFSVNVTCTANKFAPCELDRRIDSFLSKYGDTLKNLDDGVFNAMKLRTNAPNDLTKVDVGDWFNSRFGHAFALPDHRFQCNLNGVRKVSIQVLTGNPGVNSKPCACSKCSNISGWRRGQGYKSVLEYAEGQGEYRNYFV